MAKAFWKGSLGFGLVEIPVSLRPAVRSADMAFTLLDRKDFAPVGNRRYNKNTGREVPWERVVRGYEYEPDEYVVLSDEELRRAKVEASKTVEILEFVDLSEIDPAYFDTAYYVEPLKRGSKSYALLRATLERTGKAGIARVVLRTRQHLAALHVRDSVLVLSLLHYANEIIPAGEIEVPKGAKPAGVTEAEAKMAERLVEGMTASWDPERHEDTYRRDVLKLVRKKVQSGQIHTIVEPEEEAEPRPGREVVDLMPLLKESLNAQSRRPAARARPSRARPPERRRQKSA